MSSIKLWRLASSNSRTGLIVIAVFLKLADVILVSYAEVQNKMLNLSMLKEEQFDSDARVDIYREVVR